MDLRLCIFDMGGVMVDGFDVGPAMAELAGVPLAELRRLALEAGAEELHAGAITTDEFWERFRALSGLDLPGEPWGDLFRPIRRPGMYDLAERLKRAGVRVVVGTNTIETHYAVHQRQRDYDVFDAIYASQLMLFAKPDPGFWRYILEAEGVAPAEALFVDDMAVNVAAAAALGLRAVPFESEEQATAAVEAAFGLTATTT